MLGLAAGLPDPLVRLAPNRLRAGHLGLDQGPQLRGHVVAPLGVQVHGVDHGAVHIVLALGVRAVADAHGT